MVIGLTRAETSDRMSAGASGSWWTIDNISPRWASMGFPCSARMASSTPSREPKWYVSAEAFRWPAARTMSPMAACHIPTSANWLSASARSRARVSVPSRAMGNPGVRS